MARRPRKSLDDQEDEAKKVLQRVARERKELAEAQRSTRAFTLFDAINKLVEAGDEEAKRVMDRVKAGLTVKRERLAFGLDPLPVPGPDTAPIDQPAAKPPVDDPVAVALAARAQAVRVFNATDKSAADALVLGNAIAAWEKVAGQVWDQLTSAERSIYGLGDRPGERIQTSRTV